MPYLRSLLGVLLVMIALASASQSSASQFVCSDADVAGQPSEQAAAVDGLLLLKRFVLLTPPQVEKPVLAVRSGSEKPAVSVFSRRVPFQIPARLFIAQSGLLPRAPSVA